MGRKSGPSLSSPMPARSGYALTGRVQEDLAPLLVSLLGHVEIMLDPVGLQVPHARPDPRRDSTAGDEEDAHEREVWHPLQGLARNGLQERNGLPLPGSCPIVTEWRETSTIPQVTKHDLLNRPPSQESASATSPCRCGHRASAPANRSCNCTSCSRSSPRASASPC